jgi:hypothetical protein
MGLEVAQLLPGSLLDGIGNDDRAVIELSNLVEIILRETTTQIKII